MDNTYTFTVQTEDVDTLRIYCEALQTSFAIESMRDVLRSLIKYRSDSAAEINGLEMAVKIRDMFLELFPEQD